MNLLLRPPTIGDAPEIHELIRAGEIHDRHPLVTSLEEVVEYFHEPHFEPATHARLAVLDGEAVGWGRLWHVPSGEREERVYLMGTVHPDRRRRGVGSTLIEWQMEAGTALVAGSEGLPRYLRTTCFDWELEAIGLYERHGFTAVRWNEELLRGLDDLPGVTPPPDVTVVPWDRTRDEEARAVKNTAFADHWGSTPTDEATWRSWLTGHGTRLDLSFMAISGGRLVGLGLNEHFPADEQLHGRREGWIGSLAVLREWRRRGVATALIERSLRAFRDAGFTHAAIGVDSDNPTGAARLYTSLGFETQTRGVTYQLEV